ncbi:MAG: hypothetical protein FD124_817 [Alphaproteobacteria bacterium]|nr:MAG: hypothetical protein FD124_817 [Alphaproteobacteria bacterium]
MPRSPWLASAGWTNIAERPVEAMVAAILRAMCPLLPMPVMIARPFAAESIVTASANGAPSGPSMARASACKASASASIVRFADAWADIWAAAATPVLVLLIAAS